MQLCNYATMQLCSYATRSFEVTPHNFMPPRPRLFLPAPLLACPFPALPALPGFDGTWCVALDVLSCVPACVTRGPGDPAQYLYPRVRPSVRPSSIGGLGLSYGWIRVTDEYIRRPFPLVGEAFVEHGVGCRVRNEALS